MLNTQININKFSGTTMYDYGMFPITQTEGFMKHELVKITDVIDEVKTKLPGQSRLVKRVKRKRCRQCSIMKTPKKTIYHCRACIGQPGLCNEQCFDLFHKFAYM